MFIDENGKMIIVVGDITDHGGQVITGEEKMRYYNSPVARVGDIVTCPLCDGEHRIVEGHPTISIFGKGAAFEGNRTSCGARLISNSSTPTAHFTIPPLANTLVAEKVNTSDIRTHTYAIFRRQKPSDEIVLVIINNNGVGHAGLIVGTDSKAVLYDPAGSYSGCYQKPCRLPNGDPLERGSGDVFYNREVDLNDYLAYQRSDGAKVAVYKFFVPKTQADKIRANIENLGGRASFQCATAITTVLKNSGGEFSNLEDPWIIRSPWELENQLKDILYPGRGGVISPAY